MATRSRAELILVSGLLAVATMAAGEHYDRDSITFSPDGSLKQLDYAASRVAVGPLCVGVRCRDGVVLLADRLVPRERWSLIKHSPHLSCATGLAAPSTRIFNVEGAPATALLAAGMASDARSLVEAARAENRGQTERYGEPMAARSLASRVADYLHHWSCRPDRRPLAAALIVAARNEEGDEPELYCVDPHAWMARCRAYAFGLDSAAVRSLLATSDVDFEALSCEEGVKEIVKIVRQAQTQEDHHGREGLEHQYELAVMGRQTQWRLERRPPS